MRRAALAGVLVLSLLLTGCVQWFLPPDSNLTSTPTGESVMADLEPYYHQELTWSTCGNGKQCATAIAPLDWDEPAGERIELALVRQIATGGNRLGSLLVNPGGPGASGVDFIMDSVDFATGERLQASFDVVGFDPRGVGESSAVRCAAQPGELDEYFFGIVEGEIGSDEWIAATETATTTFAQRCLEHTGELLGHVDTGSAARDLDMLRAALGDEQLFYLGYSYGTLLGQVYAQLFPGKTGRLVLDGAVDPSGTSVDITLGQAEGFERALRAYLASCLQDAECPFRGTVAESMETVRALLETLAVSPLAGDDGRQLGVATMFIAIIQPLYNTANWPALGDAFASVFQGDPEVALALADSYYSRAPDGTYRNNQSQAFIAINCLGARDVSTVGSMRANAEALAQRAPVLGPWTAYGELLCANWPFDALADDTPIVAPGSADILVIGTTGDPATPYEWAVTVASTLEHGHLVTYDGEGHTAYNKSNACVQDAVDDYLIDGVIPQGDPRC